MKYINVVLIGVNIYTIKNQDKCMFVCIISCK